MLNSNRLGRYFFIFVSISILLILGVNRGESITIPGPGTVRVAGIVLKWIPKEREKNYKRAEVLVREAAAKGAKIVCTTECFLDGYCIKNRDITLEEFRSLSEAVPGGKYFSRMQKLAKELDIYLIAGITELDVDKIYNSAVLIGPGGKLLGKYRKNFLWGYENDKYTAGEDFPVYKTEYGKIGMMICFDRRHPESIKKLKKNGAELVFCLAGGGYGKENDKVVSQRSREGKVVIVFVHPVEFLVTGKSGEILESSLFGRGLDEDKKHPFGGVVQFFDLQLPENGRKAPTGRFIAGHRPFFCWETREVWHVKHRYNVVFPWSFNQTVDSE